MPINASRCVFQKCSIYLKFWTGSWRSVKICLCFPQSLHSLLIHTGLQLRQFENKNYNLHSVTSTNFNMRCSNLVQCRKCANKHTLTFVSCHANSMQVFDGASCHKRTHKRKKSKQIVE